MVVHDYNWILGSEAALDCVAKCLTIIYGEDEAFALPPKRSLSSTTPCGRGGRV